MRLAVISDIHGNLRALEAIYAHMRVQSPDVVINLGDCLSGPLWPEETAQYLIAQNWPTVRGNHDRALSEQPAADDVDGHTRACLSATSLEWVSALPLTRKLEPGILLCHGSPSDDEIFLLEEDGGDHFYPSNEALVRAKLGETTAGLILCGHTHTPRVVQLSNGQIVLNPGSVGVQAFPGLTVTGSPHARYAIATLSNGGWSFAHHAIAYDWSEAAERAKASGFASWSHGLLTGYAGKRA